MKAINEQRYYFARQSVFSRALLPSEVILAVETWITYDPQVRCAAHHMFCTLLGLDRAWGVTPRQTVLTLQATLQGRIASLIQGLAFNCFSSLLSAQQKLHQPDDINVLNMSCSSCYRVLRPQHITDRAQSQDMPTMSSEVL